MFGRKYDVPVLSLYNDNNKNRKSKDIKIGFYKSKDIEVEDKKQLKLKQSVISIAKFDINFIDPKKVQNGEFEKYIPDSSFEENVFFVNSLTPPHVFGFTTNDIINSNSETLDITNDLYDKVINKIEGLFDNYIVK